MVKLTKGFQKIQFFLAEPSPEIEEAVVPFLKPDEISEGHLFGDPKGKLGRTDRISKNN